MAIFPRWNHDATSWTAEDLDHTGTHVVLVNGFPVAKWLIQPCYLNNLDLIASSTEGPWLEHRHESGDLLRRIDTVGRTTYLQARNNHYLAWHPGPDGPQGYTLDGTFTPSAVRPALQPNGSVWFPPDGCIEPRVSELGLATAIRHPGPFLEPKAGAPWNPHTHWCVPFEIPGGTWLLRLENTRLVVHPYGDSWGYVVSVGSTFEPDACWCPEVKGIAVIWREASGAVQTRIVDTTLPRKNLMGQTPPVEPPVEPPVPMPPFTWDNVSFASHSDPHVGSWPITCSAEQVSVATHPSEDRVVFVRGAHTWPALSTDTWGVIDGSIWAFIPRPDGSWRAGTFDQMRPGQTVKFMERYYGKPYALDFDPQYVVKEGDPVGYLVSTPARGGVLTTNERTPLVVIKYGTNEVVWQEDASIVPPPDPPDPPVEPPYDEWEQEIELRLGKLEAWARAFR